MTKKIMMILSLITVVEISCSHDAVIPAKPTISFKDEVQPIFVSNCATDGCHSASGGELFSLSTYSEISSRVQAGNARKSQLYKSITTLSSVGGAMPPRGPLSEEQLRSIYVWIMQGAKNN